jgi:hypothetical protein
MMTFLSSCNEKPKISRAPAFSVETKEQSIAACVKMKQKEYNWKHKDMMEYCSEHWRGYIDFTKGVKDERDNT